MILEAYITLNVLTTVTYNYIIILSDDVIPDVKWCFHLTNLADFAQIYFRKTVKVIYTCMNFQNLNIYIIYTGFYLYLNISVTYVQSIIYIYAASDRR